MKTLIAYFSHAGENYFPEGMRYIEVGNAKIIAEKVKKLTGADIFEIDTIKRYPDNYKKCCDEAMAEQKKGELPELKQYLPSISQYDKVVLVYPCWWGTMPQAVFTFLDHYDFSGKEIVPICTHEGSGMGRSERDLVRVCPKAKVQRGIAIQGANANSCDGTLSKYFA